MTLSSAAGELASADCSLENPRKIQCVTPSWTFAAGSVSISFSNDAGVLTHEPFMFDIIPVIVSLATPSRTVAGTPSLALIEGHGFTPGASYDCVFSGLTFEAFNSTLLQGHACRDLWCNSTCYPHCVAQHIDHALFAQCMYKCFIRSGPSSSQVATSTGQAVNHSHIKCVTHLWKFPAGLVSLHVIGAEGKVKGNDLHIRFTSEVFFMTPNHGILQGSAISIRGAGLNENRQYACSLVSQSHTQNASAGLSVFDFKQLAPGKYYNFDLVCRIPPLQTCEEFLLSVRVLDLASGEMIKGSFDFEYDEGLTAIVPSAGPAIGCVNVTLVGCGFHANQPYRIVFRDPTASASHFRMTDNASFINSTAISVELPYWGFGSALTTVGLIIDGFEDTTANLTFDIFPVVTSSLPKSGHVFGSTCLLKAMASQTQTGVRRVSFNLKGTAAKCLNMQHLLEGVPQSLSVKYCGGHSQPAYSMSTFFMVSRGIVESFLKLRGPSLMNFCQRGSQQMLPKGRTLLAERQFPSEVAVLILMAGHFTRAISRWWMKALALCTR